MIVVKLGGSVSETAGRIIWELKNSGKNILIVPGGWIFADMVRKLETDDESAHWMAIAGMNVYGYYLSRYAEVIEPENFDFDVRGVRILLPYILLRKHDDLPHSWEVTSDSIAVWVAEKIGAEDIVKVTDVDGVYMDGRLVESIAASELSRETCVDSYSPKLLREYGRDMFICNGLVEGRVKDYIMKGEAKGTRIIGR
ncbi:uridylate kinase [Geoglobus acetivorans]|uniref:Uridylate kinase n=1 Tax=Geoglobus acetivorans TaxID=565033 RepID=A0ABZ3H4Z2_GEOAI|nr:uridylate kinase [Geoglobus acetivorans]